LIILLAKIGNLMIIFLTMKMGVKIIWAVTNAMDGKSKNTILEIIKPNNVQIWINVKKVEIVIIIISHLTTKIEGISSKTSF